MSQLSEDYITPIFPENAEEELETDMVEKEDDFTLVGGANRRLWPTVDAYKTKFLTMFQNGYMKGITKTTYLPPLALSDLVPIPKGRLPHGDNTNTTFDIIGANKDYDPTTKITRGYAIKELKGEGDFSKYPDIFKDSTRTTPVFYLSVFLTNALQKALELEKTPIPDNSNAAAKKIVTDLKNQLMMLVEIVVRLYILSYINIFTQQELCVEKPYEQPERASLYTYFIAQGANTVHPISILLTQLRDDVNDKDTKTKDEKFGIKKCLFGSDDPKPLKEGGVAPAWRDVTLQRLESLYDLLKDFGINYVYNDVLNIKNPGVWDESNEYSKVYFFSSMDDFLDKMIEEAQKAQQAAKDAAAKKAFENKTSEEAKKSCAALKAEIDKLPVEKRKALTEADLAALLAKNPLWTKKFIENCFEDYFSEDDMFPESQYGFFVAPTEAECNTLKEAIEAAVKAVPKKIADKKQITKKELDEVLKMSRAAVEACFANKTLFPEEQYGLAPPPPADQCDELFDALKAAVLAKIIKKEDPITDEKIAQLKKSNGEAFTRKEVADCFAKDTVKFAGYALAPLKYTDKQKESVLKILQESPSIPDIPKEYIDTKLKDDITMEIINQVIVELNKGRKGLDLKIVDTFSTVVEESALQVRTSPADGWCFYHSVNRQFFDAGEEKGKKIPDKDIPNAEAATGAEDDKTKKFIGEIKTWIGGVKDDNKKEFTDLYDLIYGSGKYVKYLENLDKSEKPRQWADPDFGVGLAAAYLKKTDIEIYQKNAKTNKYDLIKTYKYKDAKDMMKAVPADAPAEPTSKIRLLYENKNHYNILVEKQPAEENRGKAAVSWTEAAKAPAKLNLANKKALIATLKETVAAVKTKDGIQATTKTFLDEQVASLEAILGKMETALGGSTKAESDTFEDERLKFEGSLNTLNELIGLLNPPELALGGDWPEGAYVNPFKEMETRLASLAQAEIKIPGAKKIVPPSVASSATERRELTPYEKFIEAKRSLEVKLLALQTLLEGPPEDKNLAAFDKAKTEFNAAYTTANDLLPPLLAAEGGRRRRRGKGSRKASKGKTRKAGRARNTRRKNRTA